MLEEVLTVFRLFVESILLIVIAGLHFLLMIIFLLVLIDFSWDFLFPRQFHILLLSTEVIKEVLCIIVGFVLTLLLSRLFSIFYLIGRLSFKYFLLNLFHCFFFFFRMSKDRSLLFSDNLLRLFRSFRLSWGSRFSVCSSFWRRGRRYSFLYFSRTRLFLSRAFIHGFSLISKLPLLALLTYTFILLNHCRFGLNNCFFLSCHLGFMSFSLVLIIDVLRQNLCFRIFLERPSALLIPPDTPTDQLRRCSSFALLRQKRSNQSFLFQKPRFEGLYFSAIELVVFCKTIITTVCRIKPGLHVLEFAIVLLSEGDQFGIDFGSG